MAVRVMAGDTEHNEDLCNTPDGCVCLCDDCTPDCTHQYRKEATGNAGKAEEKEEDEEGENIEPPKWGRRDTMKKKRGTREK